jgi:protein-disulfide isomerase
MSHRLRTSWWSLGALFFVVLLASYGCTNSSDSSKANETAKSTATAESGEDDDEEQLDAPSANLYPGVNFGALKPAERIKFVEIAEAEVCPCPDAAESLHQCLQSPQDSCGLAMQVAQMMAVSIRKGYSETDILSDVAEYVKAANKEYDFELSDVPKNGPADAPVVLVEFADFQCPHCKAASEVLDEVTSEYDDQVVHYFKNFPLQAQSFSEVAARAALAAHEQDRFWKMHSLLFEHQRTLNEQKVMRFARRLGLNEGKFKEDLASPEIAAKVERDRREGESAGITSTPALFINGVRYMGPKSKAAVSDAIDRQLEELQAQADEKE